MGETMLTEITEAMISCYGSMESPSYEFVQRAVNARPYERLIARLADLGGIEETTDINDDVSFCFAIRSPTDEVYLQLSMLGPYAVLTHLDAGRIELVEGDDPIHTHLIRAVLRVLREGKISLLDEKTLLAAVELNPPNSENEPVNVYRALFSDTDLVPWRAA